MGAFSYHRFIFLLACIDRWKVYNRLTSVCTVNTAIAVQPYVFQQAKYDTVSGIGAVVKVVDSHLFGWGSIPGKICSFLIVS